jgi:hypothetical protein
MLYYKNVSEVKFHSSWSKEQREYLNERLISLKEKSYYIDGNLKTQCLVGISSTEKNLQKNYYEFD